MNAFAPASTAVQSAATDPTRRVNYVLGMVLGVEDFTQEHAYLSERDRWLARDLLGYGTAWGLAVTTQVGTRGPEVRVSPGVALSPRGQLIRVTPAQCAALDAWLASQGTQVDARVSGAPPNTQLKTYVVLCYRECTTDPVPIPGEPCRSEDDMMADSRIADDFTLELRFDPPEQEEEDALRDFVHWLRTHVSISSTPGTSVPLDTFLDTLRQAVVTSSPPGGGPGSPLSPPGSPLDFLLDTSPPSPLVVSSEDLCAYLRAALRVWVTELRSRWRTNWLGEAQGCTSTLTPGAPSGEDCVLLAELNLPLTRELGGGSWKVAPAPAQIRIEQKQRPFLAHLRLLQEWMLCGLQAGAPNPDAVLHPPKLPAYSLVAAGIVPADPTAAPGTPYNGLRAIALADGAVTFTFTDYQDPTGKPFQYVVKALLVSSNLVPSPSVTFGGFTATGFTLNVSNAGAPVPQATLKSLQLVIEVSRYSFS